MSVQSQVIHSVRDASGRASSASSARASFIAGVGMAANSLHEPCGRRREETLTIGAGKVSVLTSSPASKSWLMVPKRISRNVEAFHEPDDGSAAFAPLQRAMRQHVRTRKRRERRAPVQGFMARDFVSEHSHPDPLPSDGRGNPAPRVVNDSVPLGFADASRRFSLTHPTGEGGVRVCLSVETASGHRCWSGPSPGRNGSTSSG